MKGVSAVLMLVAFACHSLGVRVRVRRSQQGVQQAVQQASSHVPVFVMLPLTTITNDGRDVSSDIYWMFDKLAGANVAGFMVDVWWGITEPSPRTYMFDGYKKLFQMAKDRGWKVQVVTSFHQCGGNVGDDCFIPVPNWIPRHEGIWYKDQSGNENYEYISLFADEVKLQPNSNALALAEAESATCEVNEADRQDCGYMGIGQSECQASGCCWQESRVPGTPWCFKRGGSSPPPSERCALSDAEKRECGYMGIGESECEASGCCWQTSSTSGTPWCFKASESGSPEPSPGPEPTPAPAPSPTPPGSPADSRTPIEMYADWFAAFEDAFRGDLGSLIVEVMVGMGPAGELRYPSYQLKYWNFCGVGEFQCFDQYAEKDLREHAESRGNARWGQAFRGNDVGNYNSRPPSSVPFFNYIYQQDNGRFFLEWYFDALKAHGARVLSAANNVFGKYPGLHMAGKIAGIHWWFGDKSHAAEVTAGYYNTNSKNGYGEIAKVFKDNGNVTFCFTCLEMRNHEQPAECASQPVNLVRQTADAARSGGIPYAGENALPRYDRAAYDQILTSKPDLSAFTLLRLNPRLLEGQNFEEFKRFVHLMHQ